MWFDDEPLYQIYPLGLCGAPLQNDGSDQTGEHRILRVLDLSLIHIFLFRCGQKGANEII